MPYVASNCGDPPSLHGYRMCRCYQLLPSRLLHCHELVRHAVTCWSGVRRSRLVTWHGRLPASSCGALRLCPPAWARGVLLGLRAFQCSHWQRGHPARGDDAGPAAGHAEVRHGPAGRGAALEAIMTTYEHFQGRVRRRPTVTRHPRLQRHPTSPLGSGYAEEFELACRGYRGDPGRDCREVSSEIRRSHGPNRVNGNGSSIHLGAASVGAGRDTDECDM